MHKLGFEEWLVSAVMSMYTGAKTVVKTVYGNSNAFEVKVGMQQDIGVNANMELVDKFCYLSDRLSVDGDADAAVETRIQIGWNKSR